MNTHFKLLNIIFIPLFIGAMDQPKKNDESIIKIIELFNTKEIAFMGNKDLVIRTRGKKPFIWNIYSQEKIDFIESKWDFSQNKLDFSQAYMVTDQAKKRVLISCGIQSVEDLVIYDFCKNTTVMYPAVCSDFGVHCRNSFDERKPNSVLLRQKWPTLQDHSSIVSYDYLKATTQFEHFISQAVADTHGVCCHHVFNAQLGTRGILSETEEEFKIYMESNAEDVKAFCYKKAVPGCIEKNLVCSSEMSFIAYYCNESSCPHEESMVSKTEYLCRVCDACYILNLKTGNNICCQNSIGGVMPYAMDFHPNNKVVVTLSFDGLIEYWCADTGRLLGKHELCEIDKERNSVDTGGCYRKYLSFSDDGELLVAAFKKRCVVYKVPFEVLYGISQDKVVHILWCLKNMPCFLPKDIRYALLEKCKL